MKNLLTKEDFDFLKKEVTKLKSRTKELTRQLGDAAALSGSFLCKIPEYESLSGEIAIVESRIQSIEDILAKSEILDLDTLKGKETTPYCKVLTENQETFEIEKYYLIYPSITVNIPEFIAVSPHSPLGTALLGKKVGTEAKISLPSGIKVLKITEIEVVNHSNLA